jgi:hypothetical protein
MELASQAKPSPAAKPPNIAPQGRTGAAAGTGGLGATGAAAGAPVAAALFVGVATGLPASGLAGRGVSLFETLCDCCPIDLPPPMRFAWACTDVNANTIDRKITLSFITTFLFKIEPSGSSNT